jgi:hypothetical protein
MPVHSVSVRAGHGWSLGVLLALATGAAASLATAAPCVPQFIYPELSDPGLWHFDDGDENVKVLAKFDGSLYAGGIFNRTGTTPLGEGVARWNGQEWKSLIGGATGESGSNPPHMNTMFVWDDGFGEALYVVGDFSFIGGVEANRVARWNGAGWSTVGDGPHSVVDIVPWDAALVPFDDGTGTKLYMPGVFDLNGTVYQNRGLAIWDGTNWSTKYDETTYFSGGINCAAVYDDGSGPALYVGGTNTLWTPDHEGIRIGWLTAKWDGSHWSGLGDGLPPGAGQARPEDMVAFDDGNGEKLYVAGYASFNGVSRWDGTSWEDVGGVLDTVRDLEIFDDGNGPALYATGSTGGSTVLAKWNGVNWDILMDGLPITYALEGAMEDVGPVMYIGFYSDLFNAGLVKAILLCPEQNTCPWDFDNSDAVGVDDFFALLQHWGPCPDPDPCPWDVAGDDGMVGVDDFFALLQNWGSCPDPDQ